MLEEEQPPFLRESLGDLCEPSISRDHTSAYGTWNG